MIENDTDRQRKTWKMRSREPSLPHTHTYTHARLSSRASSVQASKIATETETETETKKETVTETEIGILAAALLHSAS